MKKKNNTCIIFKDIISSLPEHIITEEIFSFYNIYKNFYDYVIKEIQSRVLFKSCMRQLKQYTIYDKNKNVISFQKYALLSSNEV
jgi:hypothetical protein